MGRLTIKMATVVSAFPYPCCLQCDSSLFLSKIRVHFTLSWIWSGSVSWDLPWPIEYGWSDSGPGLNLIIRKPCMFLLSLLDPCILPGEQSQHSLLEGEQPCGGKEAVPRPSSLSEMWADPMCISKYKTRWTTYFKLPTAESYTWQMILYNVIKKLWPLNH